MVGSATETASTMTTVTAASRAWSGTSQRLAQKHGDTDRHGHPERVEPKEDEINRRDCGSDERPQHPKHRGATCVLERRLEYENPGKTTDQTPPMIVEPA